MVGKQLFISNGTLIRVFDLTQLLQNDESDTRMDFQEMNDDLTYLGPKFETGSMDMRRVQNKMERDIGSFVKHKFRNIIQMGQPVKSQPEQRQDAPVEQISQSSADEEYRLEVTLQRANDYQVSYCHMIYQPKAKIIKFIELENVFPRNNIGSMNESIRQDPIVRYRDVRLKNGNIAGIALRSYSKHIDFYWNRFLVDSQEIHDDPLDEPDQDQKDEFQSQDYHDEQSAISEGESPKKITKRKSLQRGMTLLYKEEEFDKNCKHGHGIQFVDVYIDFQKIYLRTKKCYYSVSLSRNSKIGLTTAKKEDNFSKKDCIQNLVKYHVKLYVDFQLSFTDLYVCHGQYVSIFDTIKRTWRHIHTPGFVISIFAEQKLHNHQITSEEDDQSSALNSVKSGCMDQSFEIRVIVQKDSTNTDNEQLYQVLWIGDVNKDTQMREHDVKEGPIMSIAEDNVSKIATFYVLNELEIPLLFSTSHGQMKRNEDEAIDEILKLNSIISVSYDLQENQMSVHLIVLNPPTDKQETDGQNEENQEVGFYVFRLTYSDKLQNFKVDVPYFQEIQEKQETKEEGKESTKKKKPLIFPTAEIYNDFAKRKEDLDFSNAHFIHYNEEKFKRMAVFIADRVFIYKISKKDIKIVHTIPLEYKILSINLIDSSWIYTIQESIRGESQGGCYAYDMFRLIKFGKINQYELTRTINGTNDILNFSRENSRICMIQDYESIAVLPSLHSSQITFFGMRERSQYLVWKEFQDHFACLDINQHISVWSKTTGKLISYQEANNQKEELSDFEIFRPSEEDQTYLRNYTNNWQLLVNKNAEKQQKVKGVQEEYLKAYQFVEGTTALEFRQFMIVELADDFKKVNIKYKFYHPYIKYDSRKSNERQRVIFSQDFEYMIDIQHESKVFVFKKIDLEKRTLVQQTGNIPIKWEFIKRIKSFPISFVDQANPMAIFSPNFQRFLDYDTYNKVFILRSTFSEEDDITIPKGLVSQEISDKFIKMTEESFLGEFVKRFMWHDNDKIRILSFVDQIDAIFPIVDGVCKDENGQPRKAFQIQSVICPRNSPFNNIQDQILQLEDNHFFYDKKLIDKQQTLKLLDQKLDFLRCEYVHKFNPYLRPLQKNRQQQKEKEQKMYEMMFSVQYNPKQNFVCQTSFTYLDWRIAEKILTSVDFNFGDVYQNQCMEMSFGIYPQFKSLMHMMVNKEVNLQELFQLTKSGFLVYEQQVQGFELPFTYDIEGKTPIDYILNKDRQNKIILEIILSNIMNYSFDHHDRMIRGKIPRIISSGLDIVGPYLDQRIKQLNYIESCRSLQRGQLKKELDSDAHILRTEPFLFDVEKFQQSIFMEQESDEEDQSNVQDKKIAQYDDKIEVDIQFIFFSDVFNDSEMGQKVMLALSRTQDLSLFTRDSVKLLIDHKWNSIRQQSVRRLLFPYLNYLLTYFCWSNFIYDFYDQSLADSFPNYAVSILLVCYSLYFFRLEFAQMYSIGFAYFTSIWNFFDIIPPVTIITMVSLFKFNSERNSYEPVLLAISGLMMWAKCLQFMRLHEESGYLIRMLIQVTQDMKIFLLVLGVTIAAFADAFYTISKANALNEDGQSAEDHEVDPEKFRYFESFFQAVKYSYLIALGEFNYDDYDDSSNPNITWAIFIISTVLNCIVMLNLLIAIVSETFSTVLSEKEENSYREKASIIHENFYLLRSQKSKMNLDSYDTLIIIKPQIGKTVDYDAIGLVEDQDEDDDGNRKGVAQQAIIISQGGSQSASQNKANALQEKKYQRQQDTERNQMQQMIVDSLNQIMRVQQQMNEENQKNKRDLENQISSIEAQVQNLSVGQQSQDAVIKMLKESQQKSEETLIAQLEANMVQMETIVQNSILTTQKQTKAQQQEIMKKYSELELQNSQILQDQLKEKKSRVVDKMLGATKIALAKRIKEEVKKQQELQAQQEEEERKKKEIEELTKEQQRLESMKKRTKNVGIQAETFQNDIQVQTSFVEDQQPVSVNIQNHSAIQFNFDNDSSLAEQLRQMQESESVEESMAIPQQDHHNVEKLNKYLR